MAVILVAAKVVGSSQVATVPVVNTNWILARSSFRSVILLEGPELAVFFATKLSGAVDSHLNLMAPSPEKDGVEICEPSQSTAISSAPPV